MALLVPIFWDWVGPNWRPRLERSSAAAVDRSRLVRILIWFGVLSLGVLSTWPLSWFGGSELPQWYVTLHEAFVAALVVCGYLLWSRRLDCDHADVDLGPVLAVGWRVGYFAIALFVLLQLSYGAIGQSPLPSEAVDWLHRNDEAFAGLLLLPVYFDVVARHSARRSAIWILVLLSVPIVVQSGVFGSVDTNSLIGWLERVTEALIAAVLVSIYFDVLRDGSTSVPNGAESAPRQP